jgi:EF hand
MMNARSLLVAVMAAPSLAASPPPIIAPSGVPGPLSRADFVERLDNFFRKMDMKGDGYVTNDDLVLPGHHIADPPIIFYPGVQMPFHCVDANRDGRISEQEYVAYGERAFDAVATNGTIMMPWNASQLRRAISTDSDCK